MLSKICLLFLAAVVGGSPEVVLMGYLGGSGTDDCDGITLDRAGDIYLACHSDSADFPNLPAKPAPRSNADMDAVVVKIAARTGKVAWATRTGGSDWDAAGGIQVGKDGSVYVLGQTQSADFPTTPDAVQRKFGGPRRDLFVLKLDAGGKIVYSTFLGGSKNDEPGSLAVAEDGTVYMDGVTWSADFPGLRMAQFGPGGAQDAFLACLRPGDPNSLKTVVIGGTGREQPGGLALDQSGNLFVTGITNSSDFPVKNALQPSYGGEGDGFLIKVRVSDWSLLFSTYLGGSKLDFGSSVALDSEGNPILFGFTGSEDFVITPQAFQRQRRGTFDAFVTKLDRDGGRVIWSTHYGGSKETVTPIYDGGAMAIDQAGRVWIASMTAARDLPLRNAYQPSFGGGEMDGFLAAFSPDGSKLCYGSYVGGPRYDNLEGLAIGNGKVYASGISATTNLRQKGWQAQPAYGGGPYDALVLGMDTQVTGSCK